ncbi:hypothetical protein GGTG_00400 [Gaeumannomyces tritici R3-111a-1]|uniref:Meiotically up-regulated 65 protein n=1 Tax=Gaeumannomyces tritici (strain R3-111a-1) TaxID=644352 RepID=J3NGL0_GAET3|nr:hypothetical protein GGTG_00400 [Gaeumannomyces tritici R3-111a-1]EJT80400.1 hypothetical protein GGTG_00400 [Gaeumannomyces tritici R3-111a-1]
MTKSRILRPHTSRRASIPKDSDFDHEIALVEEDTHLESSASPEPADPGIGPSTPSADAPPATTGRRASSASNRPQSSDGDRPLSPRSHRRSNVGAKAAPTIAVEQPTPFEPAVSTLAHRDGTGFSREVNSAIDILYENERGALCCGRPLFASQALGNLDPPAWTNVAHKPSPTDIRTAQVPDPSWDWAWPEWRVNHEEQGTDKDGWEYSFAFHKKFSWHGPKWWNSFVRRRAWTRRRVKKDQIRQAHGGSLLQPEYFTVRSSAEMARRRSSAESSGLGSKRGSMMSVSIASQATGGADAEKPDIRDVQELLLALRACRIDREKIEALENYLENGDEDDLVNLEAKMPEVMGFFVFQTSRRLLVQRLTELHDQTQAEAGQQKDEATRSSRAVATEEALAAALRRADEEVKRLEYWSDVKEVAETGHSHGAVDGKCGWDDSWEGVDNSGPAAPDPQAKK